MSDWTAIALEELSPYPVHVFPGSQVYKWFGSAKVTFDSGREEIRLWAGTIMMESAMTELLWRAKLANALDSMRRFMTTTERGGWPRHNRRGRRRFARIEWIRP